MRPSRAHPARPKYIAQALAASLVACDETLLRTEDSNTDFIVRSAQHRLRVIHRGICGNPPSEAPLVLLPPLDPPELALARAPDAAGTAGVRGDTGARCAVATAAAGASATWAPACAVERAPASRSAGAHLAASGAGRPGAPFCRHLSAAGVGGSHAGRGSSGAAGARTAPRHQSHIKHEESQCALSPERAHSVESKQQPFRVRSTGILEATVRRTATGTRQMAQPGTRVRNLVDALEGAEPSKGNFPLAAVAPRRASFQFPWGSFRERGRKARVTAPCEAE